MQENGITSQQVADLNPPLTRQAIDHAKVTEQVFNVGGELFSCNPRYIKKLPQPADKKDLAGQSGA